MLTLLPHPHYLVIAPTLYPLELHSAQSKLNALACRIRLVFSSYVLTFTFLSLDPPRWHHQRPPRRTLTQFSFLSLSLPL